MFITKKAIFSIFCIYIFTVFCFGFDTEIKNGFNDLISKHKLDEASELLKEKKTVLKKKLLQKYYIQLGKAYQKENRNIKAFECYSKVSDQKKKIKKVLKNLAKIIGEEYLAKGDYKNSLKFYKINGEWEKIKSLSYVNDGEINQANGNYKQALSNYKKSGFEEKIAWYYGVIAADYKKKGEMQLAKSFYKKAIDKYESILRSLEYIWNEKFNKYRLLYISELNSFDKNKEEQKQNTILKKILYETGNYCVKLKDQSLNFYCDEYVSENIEFSYLKNLEKNTYDISKKTGKKNNTYVYSYQLVQKNNKIKETRELLGYRGKRKRQKVKKKDWETHTVILKRIIFGPSGMFGFYWQRQNNYKIIGEDNINKRKVYIIECIPKNPFKTENFLFGKAWIDVDDYTIMKIEWAPKAIGYSNNFLKIARSLSKKPYLAWNIEYFLKRGGIRYPTKCYYEESFVKKDGKRNTSLTLNVKFKNHRFFVVGTETEIKPVDID